MTQQCCPTCNQPIPALHGIVLVAHLRTLTFRGRTIQVPPMQFTMLERLVSIIDCYSSIEDFVGVLYDHRSDSEMPRDPYAVVRTHLCELRKLIRPLGLEIVSMLGRGSLGWKLVRPAAQTEAAA